MYPTIREPKQKRAKEKKERIIEAGWELISKNGYYSTNTAEIAKEAGVSTGIVYQYFQDKHDILMEAIDRHMDDVFFPMINVKNIKIDFKEYDNLMRRMLNKYIKNHNLSKVAHEEIIAMVHSDEEVAKKFYEKEIETANSIKELLMFNGVEDNNLDEKVHIMMGMIDNVCHEVTYHRHKEINYDKMIDLVVDNIRNLFKNDF